MDKDTDKDYRDVNNNMGIEYEELDEFIQNLHYPAKKQDILEIAMRDGPESKITSSLQMITEKYYSSAEELTRELEIVE